MNGVLHIICFYWQGDRWQQKGYVNPEGYINPLQHLIDRVKPLDDSLPAKYVSNLYEGVERFSLGREFKFICFTNEPLIVRNEIEIRSFPMITKMGVLPRLWMFSEDSGLFGNQVLCLDLDTIIVGDLRDIMSYKGLFCTLPKIHIKDTAKLGGGVIGFQACKDNEKLFWKTFIRNKEAVKELTQGRERQWFSMVAKDVADRWSEIVPGQMVSYKLQARNGIPKGARIVYCHGTQRPHEIRSKWIKEYWI